MNSNYFSLIEAQEEEDRKVTSELLTDILTLNGSSDIECTPTDIYCSVDLSCKCKLFDSSEYKFNVEIKRNNKTQDQLEKFPHALLKKDKLDRMIKASPDTPLYYIILLNQQIAYIYNVRSVNWNEVELVNLTQKRTQFNPNSDYIKVPTYRIPYDLAVTKPIQQYYS